MFRRGKHSGKVSGAWVLRGTRTPVKALFENLEAGLSIDEVMEQFPVSREQMDRLTARREVLLLFLRATSSKKRGCMVGKNSQTANRSKRLKALASKLW